VRARVDLAAFITEADYPLEARRNEEQGTVGFEVVVAPNGTVRRCRVSASSGFRSLDRATCDILSDRVRFSPARDASGRAVADTFAGRVQWALPPPDPEAPPVRAWPLRNLASYVASGDYPEVALRRDEQGRVEFAVEVGPDGRVTRCHIMQSSGSQLLDLRTCQIMLVRARFDPARDAAGNPVADVFGSSITWSIR
jgi:TonB family protein